jgi:hypothetical protein
VTTSVLAPVAPVAPLQMFCVMVASVGWRMPSPFVSRPMSICTPPARQVAPGEMEVMLINEDVPGDPTGPATPLQTACEEAISAASRMPLPLSSNPELMA